MTVCEFCGTTVGRGDKSVEDHGKVADLLETDSIVHRGSTGSYRGKPFECIGRVQYQHAAGGVWDEWYLRFPGDRMAWLAEAQGQLHLTFERPIRKKNPLPDFESIDVGQRIEHHGTAMTVVEKGTAIAKSAEGEIPWVFVPGKDHIYIDLKGDAGWFATFDYGASPTTYVGRTVTADQLEIQTPAWIDAQPPRPSKVSAVHLNCPKCAGPLSLFAPDQALRVVCPHCSASLDVADGKLKLLQTLKQKEIHPVIPLGSSGVLRGVDYTVIGFMERFIRCAGTTYPWTEYLLHNPDSGFAWLIRSERHWTLAIGVSPHEATRSDMHATHDGIRYRLFEKGTAHVRTVYGEFYWKVEIGETAWVADYIRPPFMLSFERSYAGNTEEIQVSRAEHVPPEEIEKAFGIKELLRPWGVGPVQPSPPVHPGVWLSWAGFLAFLFVIHIAFQRSPLSATPDPDPWMLFYGVLFVSLIPGGILAYKYSFEVSRWKDSDYSPYASSDE
ncbi:MAG: DUF4178 domain-containing protein [Planctomycetota bacterium]